MRPTSTGGSRRAAATRKTTDSGKPWWRPVGTSRRSASAAAPPRPANKSQSSRSGVAAGDGDDGRDRRGGRYREEERAGAGREVVRGRAAAAVPEQVPPQPDARFAVRWDLHGGRGSLELCLSLPTPSRAFRGWWGETTSDGAKRRRGPSTMRWGGASPSTRRRGRASPSTMRWAERVRPRSGGRARVRPRRVDAMGVRPRGGVASAGRRRRRRRRRAGRKRNARRRQGALGCRSKGAHCRTSGIEVGSPQGGEPLGESFDRRGATAAVPPAEGSAPRTRDSLAGHEAWARRSQVV